MAQAFLSLRLARREMRTGVKGFGIFLTCLVLGVASIAGVGSLKQSLLDGLEREGRVLLGGDVELRLSTRSASVEDLDYLKSAGTVSGVTEMRAMARPASGGDSTLIELKAVDGLYPLLGAMGLNPPQSLHGALAAQDGGVAGVVVENTLLARLGLAVGERLKIGDGEFEIRAVIEKEPDRGARGIAWGPRVMMTARSLSATGLVREGSLMRRHYRIRLAPQVDLDHWKKALEERFPDAGWRLVDRNNSAPGVRRFIDRMGLFLTLAGLTALVVGGVGIANAVTGYLHTRRETIAVLKCLGAGGGLIFRIYLGQIMALAALGIAAGLALGAFTPMLIGAYLADKLPIEATMSVHPAPLLVAAAYGALTALAFSVWPLARARELPAAGLFRDLVAPARRWPRRRYIALSGAAVAGMAALAVMFSGNPGFAGWFVVGAALSFIVLRGVGTLLMHLAARAGRPKSRRLRMALANLYRPGAATPIATLSLGLGLTLMVAVALIEGNLSAQVSDRMPKDAPSFFFIDIQPDQLAAFDQAASAVAGAGERVRVPMLRGHITRIAGVPVAEAEILPEARWAVRGDRGLTYAALPPQGNRVTAGAWWPADYDGPPAISFDEDLARGMGVGVGDRLTINVLGREIEARIANLRAIDWNTLGINFAIVFAPGALEAAPHTYLATLKSATGAEDAIHRAVTARLPNVTAIRVRDMLETVNKLLSDIGNAVRATGSIAILSGILVLAGAMAGGQRERIYDAVVLKVLGARRRDVLAPYLIEYALLGLITAMIAASIGTLASYLVIAKVMEGDWIFLPTTLLVTVFGAVIATVLLGLAGTWRVLGQKPSRILRTE
ncbi:MAG: ABC transporter permease [Sphingomonadales bacterium]